MATAATYALYAVASLVAPSICTTLGARATLFLGSLGYSVYVASLLLYHLGVVPAALVVAAGALNGVCAGLLWVANGVLLYTYAGVDGRGFLFGVFWVVFNLGAVVGGVLSFAENFEHTGAKASTSTFATFLSLMVLGALLTFALAPPGRVVRADGSAAPTQPPIPLCAELVAMGALLVDRRTVALAPLFLFSNWFYAFQFTCFNARLFDARSQGLNNAVYWGMQMGGALLFGRWLDAASVAPRRRAFKALAALSALVALTWSLALWVAASYGLDGAATAQPTLDAIDDPGRVGAAVRHLCRLGRDRRLPADVLVLDHRTARRRPAAPRPLHRSVPLPPVGRRRRQLGALDLLVGLRRRVRGRGPAHRAGVGERGARRREPPRRAVARHDAGARQLSRGGARLSPTGTAAATAVARLSWFRYSVHAF